MGWAKRLRSYVTPIILIVENLFLRYNECLNSPVPYLSFLKYKYYLIKRKGPYG